MTLTGLEPKGTVKPRSGLTAFERYLYWGYGLFAAVGVPTFAVIMLMSVLLRDGQGLIIESRLYSVGFPVMAGAIVTMIFGVILLSMRASWALPACAFGGALTAGAYFLPMLAITGRAPMDVASLSMLIIPIVMLLMLPVIRMQAQLREHLQAQSLEVGQPKVHAVGTLRYTAFGLFMVFVWLLWGDFIFTLLDGCLPQILPLKLKEMEAGDTVNAILTKSVAYAVAFLLAPAIGFRSDRHRGKHGRRLPYLIWSTPFVGLFLVLIGFYDDITRVLVGNSSEVLLWGMHIGRGTVTLIVLGALIIGFDFANIFVNTIYWYLFNDVVPQKLLSQFMSLFRMVGIAATMIYSKWIFPQTMTHFRFLFVAAGIIYVIGFMAMCFMVKEGRYPPPPQNVDKRRGLLSSIKTFSRECFTHRFYWYFFLANTFSYLSQQINMFTTIRNNKSLGLSLEQLGDIGVWTSLISFLLMYPTGWLADKFNPIRVYVITASLSLLARFADLAWLKDYGEANLLIMYVLSMAFLPISAVRDSAEIPMFMRLLPKARYGQFCSANAMVKGVVLIFGSALAGLFMTALAEWTNLGEWRYRFIPIWQIFWMLPQIFCLVMLYREWKARGGDKGYVPPEA